MPRMGRIVLPNYPHHVVQRGHNRQVVFASDEDYQRYLTDLRELKDAFGVKVYADDQSRAFAVGAWRVHDRSEPTDEGAGGPRHALPQPAGGALRYALGKPLQIQRRANGDLS